jgi:hypothetical protein
VRRNALKVLHKLYGDTEHVAPMDLFTKRFRHRLVEIATADKDVDTQIDAIALATELSKYVYTNHSAKNIMTEKTLN